ncbi:hypothetical protein NM208_g13994 [Fusarium decemcellulare]|uniref:Uncharacterized protein n=1 Tax=Fusarium decemcellulare TaxID=57161 RepID=A0ACC1RJK6_9HYPO|nr:hypothetical protein NM208_g13994 [Fusarium decemcellulare]
MNLTRLRIRGKRKTRTSHNPPSSLRPNPHSPSTDDSDAHKPKKMKRSLSDVLASRSSRWRPNLQALPAEVLESIFLYSSNLALPRSSPIIGAKLSDRVTLLRLFMWAFHDCWDKWFGIAIEGPPLSDDDLSYGDPAYQSAILALPWVTVDLILQAQQTWVDTYAKDRYYEHCIPRFDADGGPIKHNYDHDFENGTNHFNAHNCFEADYQEVLTWDPFAKVERWGACEVHPRMRTPRNVLNGPWDDEKLRRLFWLRRAGNMGFFNDLNWEDRLDGLRQAFIDAPVPSVLMTNCVDLETMCHGIPRDVARKERQRIDDRLKWGADDPTGKEILREVYKCIGLWHDGFAEPYSAKDRGSLET